MKTIRRQPRARSVLARGNHLGKARPSVRAAPLRAARGPSGELADMRARLADAEEALRAIRHGEVDAVMVAGKGGPQVFTLDGADHAYRELIESMNEGALTLTADKTILYANQRFARMIKSPLQQVIGSSFRRLLSAEDLAFLPGLLHRGGKAGAKIQARLKVSDGSQMPVQISIRPLARKTANRAAIGMVLTDLTEARRTEELLRALTRRVVQVQEIERGRVAFELHEHITQPLCAILVGCQALADKISARDGSSRAEATKLRDMLGQTADEVERITRNLRPGVLAELGLVAVVRDTGTAFADRTGVSLKLTCARLAARLPADTELTLYRILQEALRNIEQHARARHVSVSLRQRGAFVCLAINDDGIGFDPGHHPAHQPGKSRLGLLSMRERAGYVGGTFQVKSIRPAGTEIEVRIPLPPNAKAPKRSGT